MTTTTDEGWLRPTGARKWHYFRDLRSLCGHYLIPAFQQGALLPSDLADGPDDCAPCRRRREPVAR